MVQDSRVSVVIIELEPQTDRFIHGCLSAAGFAVGRPVPTIDDAVRMMASSAPDVVVMDLALLGTGANVSTLREALAPSTRVVCTADEAGWRSIEQAAEIQAAGIVMRPFLDGQLVASVRLASALARSAELGTRRLDQPLTAEQKLRAIAALVNDTRSVTAEANAEGLTNRELEIADLLANGARVVTIAQRLGLSPHTVRNHLKSVLRKLNVHGQHELFEYWRGQRAV